jgi:hypothetical protein
MRRRNILVGGALATVAVMAVVTAPAWTSLGQETPFPSAKLGVFVSAQTVTTPESGYITNYFAQGETVVFRVYAGDNASKNALTDKLVRSAIVQIPGQPSVKLSYDKRNPKWPWIGSWTIPADYTPGIVPFKAMVTSKTKQVGTFTQIPVATSQLTVTVPTP